jgi:hypothetical protein
MVSEQYVSAQPDLQPTQQQRRRRTAARGARRASVTRLNSPEPAALRATIRALWCKERTLGVYSPADEVGLDLETLDLNDLRALKTRILARLHHRITSIVQADEAALEAA